MKTPRRGEPEAPSQQSPRFFARGRQWYFRTREGPPIGPFEYLSEAVFAARNYAECARRAPALADVADNG